MKLCTVTLAALCTVCLLAGCSGGGNKKEKNKGPVEETVDYATGKTPLDAGQKMKARLIQTSIQNAVNSFEAMEGKRPASLKELVDGGYLSKQYLKDEWGRELITRRVGEKLQVRSMGPDKKPETADDWVKEF